MARKPYRVEIINLKSGKQLYYLVKDVQVNNRRAKIRKYLASRPLSVEEIENFQEKYRFDMDILTARKKAELNSSFYSSEFLNKEEIAALEEIRWMYDIVMEYMDDDEINDHKKQFEVQYIQGTTSIEGNTFSIAETRKLFDDGEEPENKTPREIHEVRNFISIIDYRNKHRGEVDLKFIKNIHARIMANIDFKTAGEFRKSDNVRIMDSDIIPTPADYIEVELQDAIDEYYKCIREKRHPFECAIIFHNRFERIHPFNDGNGRVGRELLNLLLMRKSFPRLILGKDRDLYLDAMKDGDDGDYTAMIKIFSDIINEQLSDNLSNILKMYATGK